MIDEIRRHSTNHVAKGTLEKSVLSSWRGAIIKDKSLWVKWRFGKDGQGPELRFNPVLVVISLLSVAGVGLWCIVRTEEARNVLRDLEIVLGRELSWFYVMCRAVWIVAVFSLYFSKYGDVKLGKDRDKPKYSGGTWFAMIFCCGVGVNIFLYGASEPVYHYTKRNRYTSDGYLPDNSLAQIAVTLSFFHWGLHSWISYVLVALTVGFLTHRKGLPMTFKSCLYPLLGDRIYSWIGEVVDVVSVVSTLLAMVSVVGAGALQINSGLSLVFPSWNTASSTIAPTIVVWCLTGITAVGVLSEGGVRRVCEVCLATAILLIFTVLFSDDTSFLLSLFFQSVGDYLHNVVKLGFNTDAWEEMNITSSLGAARGRFYPDGQSDGPVGWLEKWTLYYWGMWVSWSPFAGVFIARISRGRTVREVISGALVAPITLVFLWVATFGGAAMRSERNAAVMVSAEVPLCCPAEPAQLNWGGAVLAGGRWREELLTDVQEDDYFIRTSDGVVNCTREFISLWDTHWKGETADVGLEVKNFGTFYNTSRNRYKISIVRPGDQLYFLNSNRTAARLSCLPPEDLWYSLLLTYPNLGGALCVASLIAVLLFITTSTSAGVLVVDTIVANGERHPPRVQRIFWCCVLGGVASAALAGGGKAALAAIQTASELASLPFYVVLCVLCAALWRGLAMECGDVNPYGTDFTVGILDPLIRWKPTLWCSFIKNLILTPVTIFTITTKTGTTKRSAAFTCILSYFFWICWIFLLILQIHYPGWEAVGWLCYLVHGYMVGAARGTVRDRYQIYGTLAEDILAGLVLYPGVAVQLQAVIVKKGLSTALPLPYRISKPKQDKL